MSTAAQQLHFSQPSISQAIKELETHYNTLLFERLSKRLYITKSGQQLQSMASGIISQFDVLESEMRHNTLTPHFYLGATITCGCCLLPIILDDFRALLPHVNVTSTIHNTHQIETELLNGRLDAAIVEGVITHSYLTSIPTTNDYLVLACHSKHPFAQKQTFTPQDLEGQDFVMREEGSGTRALFEGYLTRHKVSINRKIEAPFPEAMRHAILYNNCLGVLSNRLVEKEVAQGTIHTIYCSSSEWHRTFNVVYHKDKYLSESISTLTQLMYDA